jgi:hypothetical protein
VDHVLRRSLIEALKSRRWTPLDAERAAAGVAGVYLVGEGEWKVWPSGNADKPDAYRVSCREKETSVYDSPQEKRARDVASALNELEQQNSDATGTH